MLKALLITLLFLYTTTATAAVDHNLADKQALILQATQGSVDAQYTLGLSYVTKDGETQNNAKAAQWFRKAAEQGHVDAQSLLAMMYSSGLGVPHDNTEAARWYREAAEQGDGDSQATIAVMYYHGLGVSKSKVSAYQWATIALTNPSLSLKYQSDLQEALAELTAELTPSEIAEAEKLVKQWQATRDH